MLATAIVFITLALILYSIGVWAEKLKGVLEKWHVVIFWLGFACDTAGTSLMSILAKSNAEESAVTTGQSLHAITGILAIILMLFHAVWASVVIIKQNESSKRSFHKFSLFVWFIWLVPYIIGMVMGMA